MDIHQKSNFQSVAEFHQKFGFPVAGENGNKPHLLDETSGQQDIAEFRKKFLKEEFDEFCRAQEEGDIVQIADALVDLVYVALGTAHYYGLPFDELFEEVQRSNMEKIRVAHEGESKRGTAWDVRKPVGWKPPDLGFIIANQFFKDMLKQKEEAG